MFEFIRTMSMVLKSSQSILDELEVTVVKMNKAADQLEEFASRLKTLDKKEGK